MLRILHSDLANFLHTRMDQGGPDAEACYRIIARQNYGDIQSVPNYFMAVANERDKKRALISQTTVQAMLKAGIDPSYVRNLWQPGGHRVQIRPGRWVRAMTDIEDGYALDAFTLALDSVFGVPDLDVEFLEGPAITKAYSEYSHCRCTSLGDLANSCMRYSNLKDAFKMYEKTAKLAVVKCPTCQGIRGRAVAWEAGDKRYIDRRYGPGHIKQLIRDTALAMGYEDVWPGEVGAYHTRSFTIPFDAKSSDFDMGPYMDSLYYWCRTCRILTNQGRSCYDSGHDVTVMRGTRGTDHDGWWGKCADCGTTLNHSRMCPRRRTCEGCNASWCATSRTMACPNECTKCLACGTMRAKGTKDCPKGCVHCSTCNTDNPWSRLNQTHGRCSGCGEEIKTDNLSREVRFRGDSYGTFTARCPECNWKIVTEEAGPRSGLIPCEHVHNGPYTETGGHCRQCHAYLVMLAPEVRDDRPSTRRIPSPPSNYYDTMTVMREQQGMTPTFTFTMPTTRRGRD
jgi:hypothetical protein